MEEPSVLDFFKALLTPWREAPPAIPPLPDDAYSRPLAAETPTKDQPAQDALRAGKPIDLQLAATRIGAALFSLLAAMIAQMLVEQNMRSTSLPFYLLAAGLAVYAVLQRRWTLPAHRTEEQRAIPLSVKTFGLMVGFPFALFAFLTFGGNRFSSFNLLLWLAAITLFIWAFWLPGSQKASRLQQIKVLIQRPGWDFSISRWTVILLVAFGVAIFFRTYQLEAVNREMISSHAEKLNDIYDIFQGQSRIFFERNTGRLGLQMYLAAGIIKLFNTGYTFLSLKLSTVLAGLFMLPYLYLLGKEIGNRYVGLFAVALCGIAFWPNILGRIGLRFILFPAFVAPALYYLIRGLRRLERNDFILSGIALGIGLYGYAPVRVLPFVIIAAVILFVLHRQSLGMRREAIIFLGVLLFIAFLFFLPQVRFVSESMQNRDIYNYRTMIRLGELERPYPGPPLAIFFGNFWNALLLPNLYNASDWTVSVPQRPMLDIISASLFFLGIVVLVVRYIRERHWLDIFLLLSVPLLMLPSMLSLAFPIENPSNTRAAGAIVPVFLIAALALESMLRSIKDHLSNGSGLKVALVLGAFLLYWSASLNYSLVFRQYEDTYNSSTWNNAEMGSVIGEFIHTIGDENSAWMLVYPHWGDSRLVALHAGFPNRSFELPLDNLSNTLNFPVPKIFLVNRDHQEALDALRALYPLGISSYYQSETGEQSRDFYIYIVLPERDS